jgi:hypothetical protein
VLVSIGSSTLCGRQADRYNHWNRATQSRVRQQRLHAVPQSVCERATIHNSIEIA